MSTYHGFHDVAHVEVGEPRPYKSGTPGVCQRVLLFDSDGRQLADISIHYRNANNLTLEPTNKQEKVAA